MAENARDAGWEVIFSQLPILKSVEAAGYYDITADQIKQISKLEPRIMAKIDFKERLPPVMGEAGLAILAISNGLYRVGRFDPFIPINPEIQAEAKTMAFPGGYLTLNPKELTNESAALDAALLSGILTDVFGEEVALTVRGRSRSVPIKFSLNNIEFPIDGVQIEVDGGYEGAKTINLVEAKIGARSNISVRQLLYPQLAWGNQINGRKEVRTFLCFYQEPLLRFIPVVYDGSTCAADHARERVFALEPEARLTLMAFKENPSVHAAVAKEGVPFPQANNFETVLAMLAIVAQHGDITKEELSPDFDLDPRQIDYYANIMRWLGLVTVKDATIHMTDTGRKIAAMGHAERLAALAQIIFAEPIFYQALRDGIKGVNPDALKRWSMSGTTIPRRLQTVGAWIKYFRSFEK